MQEEVRLSENVMESTLVELSENVTESTLVEHFPQSGHLEEGACFLSDCEESKV